MVVGTCGCINPKESRSLPHTVVGVPHPCCALGYDSTPIGADAIQRRRDEDHPAAPVTKTFRYKTGFSEADHDVVRLWYRPRGRSRAYALSLSYMVVQTQRKTETVCNSAWQLLFCLVLYIEQINCNKCLWFAFIFLLWSCFSITSSNAEI